MAKINLPPANLILDGSTAETELMFAGSRPGPEVRQNHPSGESNSTQKTLMNLASIMPVDKCFMVEMNSTPLILMDELLKLEIMEGTQPVNF